MNNTRRTLGLAAVAGVLCGVRSMAPAAALTRALLRKRRRRHGPVSDGLTGGVAAAMLPFFAAGELIADKTPLVPNRIDLPPLIGRIGMAKLCAVAIAEQRREGIFVPASVAAASAIAGAYASFHLRRLLTTRAGLPDPVVALAEDAAVLCASDSLAKASLDV